MRSIFQQKIHEGNVMLPEHYILDEASYHLVKRHARLGVGEVINVDKLDYRRLVGLYQARFDKVVVVPQSRLKTLSFLQALLPTLSADKISELSKCIDHAARLNVAYSMSAMKLTFAREKVLRRFGLKSFGSNDIRVYTYRSDLQEYISGQEVLKSAETGRGSQLRRRTWNSLGLMQKAYQFPHRALRRLGSAFNWRRLMQGPVHMLLPYARYQLPDELPMGVSREANKIFYNQLKASRNGYLTLAKADSTKHSDGCAK